MSIAQFLFSSAEEQMLKQIFTLFGNLHRGELVWGENCELKGTSYLFHFTPSWCFVTFVTHCVIWAGLEQMFFPSQPPSSGIMTGWCHHVQVYELLVNCHL